MTWIHTALFLFLLPAGPDFGPAPERPPAKARIVLLRLAAQLPEEAWPEAEMRVRAELEVHGFEVICIDAQAEAGDRRQQLESLARQHQAIAGVLLSRKTDESSVQIWLVDEITGKTLIRRLEFDESDQDRAALVGLRIVELFHASLIELRTGHPPRRTKKPPAYQMQSVDRLLDHVEPLPAFGLHVGLAGLLPFADGSSGLALDIGGALRMSPHSALVADVELGLQPIQVSSDMGQADLRLFSARLGWQFEWRSQSIFSPLAGLSAGCLALWLTAADQGELTGGSDRTISGLISAQLGFRLRISNSFRLLSRFQLSSVLPKIGIEFAGSPVRDLGWPLLDVMIALEWSPSPATAKGEKT